MTEIANDKKLWDKAIENFAKLYDSKPSSPKDYARVSLIYSKAGGTFKNQESIIPFTIKESLHKEGVLDTVSKALGKILKNPIALGIALYFLNNLYKKYKN